MYQTEPTNRSSPLVSITFNWLGGGNFVEIRGSFGLSDHPDWKPMTMTWSNELRGYFITLNLVQGKIYNYKFVVDGMWVCDPKADTSIDAQGNLNNIMYVPFIDRSGEEDNCAEAKEDQVEVESNVDAKEGEFYEKTGSRRRVSSGSLHPDSIYSLQSIGSRQMGGMAVAYEVGSVYRKEIIYAGPEAARWEQSGAVMRHGQKARFQSGEHMDFQESTKQEKLEEKSDDGTSEPRIQVSDGYIRIVAPDAGSTVASEAGNNTMTKARSRAGSINNTASKGCPGSCECCGGSKPNMGASYPGGYQVVYETFQPEIVQSRGRSYSISGPMHAPLPGYYYQTRQVMPVGPQLREHEARRLSEARIPMGGMIGAGRHVSFDPTAFPEQYEVVDLSDPEGVASSSRRISENVYYTQGGCKVREPGYEADEDSDHPMGSQVQTKEKHPKSLRQSNEELVIPCKSRRHGYPSYIALIRSTSDESQNLDSRANEGGEENACGDAEDALRPQAKSHRRNRFNQPAGSLQAPSHESMHTCSSQENIKDQLDFHKANSSSKATHGQQPFHRGDGPRRGSVIYSDSRPRKSSNSNIQNSNVSDGKGANRGRQQGKADGQNNHQQGQAHLQAPSDNVAGRHPAAVHQLTPYPGSATQEGKEGADPNEETPYPLITPTESSGPSYAATPNTHPFHQTLSPTFGTNMPRGQRGNNQDPSNAKNFSGSFNGGQPGQAGSCDPKTGKFIDGSQTINQGHSGKPVDNRGSSINPTASSNAPRRQPTLESAGYFDPTTGKFINRPKLDSSSDQQGSNDDSMGASYPGRQNQLNGDSLDSAKYDPVTGQPIRTSNPESTGNSQPNSNIGSRLPSSGQVGANVASGQNGCYDPETGKFIGGTGTASGNRGGNITSPAGGRLPDSSQLENGSLSQRAPNGCQPGSYDPVTGKFIGGPQTHGTVNISNPDKGDTGNLNETGRFDSTTNGNHPGAGQDHDPATCKSIGARTDNADGMGHQGSSNSTQGAGNPGFYDPITGQFIGGPGHLDNAISSSSTPGGSRKPNPGQNDPTTGKLVDGTHSGSGPAANQGSDNSFNRPSGTQPTRFDPVTGKPIGASSDNTSSSTPKTGGRQPGQTGVYDPATGKLIGTQHESGMRGTDDETNNGSSINRTGTQPGRFDPVTGKPIDASNGNPSNSTPCAGHRQPSAGQKGSYDPVTGKLAESHPGSQGSFAPSDSQIGHVDPGTGLPVDASMAYHGDINSSNLTPGSGRRNPGANLPGLYDPLTGKLIGGSQPDDEISSPHPADPEVGGSSGQANQIDPIAGRLIGSSANNTSGSTPSTGRRNPNSTQLGYYDPSTGKFIPTQPDEKNSATGPNSGVNQGIDGSCNRPSGTEDAEINPATGRSIGASAESSSSSTPSAGRRQPDSGQAGRYDPVTGKLVGTQSGSLSPTHQGAGDSDFPTGSQPGSLDPATGRPIGSGVGQDPTSSGDYNPSQGNGGVSNSTPNAGRRQLDDSQTGLYDPTTGEFVGAKPNDGNSGSRPMTQPGADGSFAQPSRFDPVTGRPIILSSNSISSSTPSSAKRPLGYFDPTTGAFVATQPADGISGSPNPPSATNQGAGDSLVPSGNFDPVTGRSIDSSCHGSNSSTPSGGKRRPNSNQTGQFDFATGKFIGDAPSGGDFVCDGSSGNQPGQIDPKNGKLIALGSAGSTPSSGRRAPNSSQSGQYDPTGQFIGGTQPIDGMSGSDSSFNQGVNVMSPGGSSLTRPTLIDPATGKPIDVSMSTSSSTPSAGQRLPNSNQTGGYDPITGKFVEVQPGSGVPGTADHRSTPNQRGDGSTIDPTGTQPSRFNPVTGQPIGASTGSTTSSTPSSGRRQPTSGQTGVYDSVTGKFVSNSSASPKIGVDNALGSQSGYYDPTTGKFVKPNGGSTQNSLSSTPSNGRRQNGQTGRYDPVTGKFITTLPSGNDTCDSTDPTSIINETDGRPGYFDPSNGKFISAEDGLGGSAFSSSTPSSGRRQPGSGIAGHFDPSTGKFISSSTFPSNLGSGGNSDAQPEQYDPATGKLINLSTGKPVTESVHSTSSSIPSAGKRHPSSGRYDPTTGKFITAQPDDGVSGVNQGIDGSCNRPSGTEDAEINPATGRSIGASAKNSSSSTPSAGRRQPDSGQAGRYDPVTGKLVGTQSGSLSPTHQGAGDSDFPTGSQPGSLDPVAGKPVGANSNRSSSSTPSAGRCNPNSSQTGRYDPSTGKFVSDISSCVADPSDTKAGTVGNLEGRPGFYDPKTGNFISTATDGNLSNLSFGEKQLQNGNQTGQYDPKSGEFIPSGQGVQISPALGGGLGDSSSSTPSSGRRHPDSATTGHYDSITGKFVSRPTFTTPGADGCSTGESQPTQFVPVPDRVISDSSSPRFSSSTLSESQGDTGASGTSAQPAGYIDPTTGKFVSYPQSTDGISGSTSQGLDAVDASGNPIDTNSVYNPITGQYVPAPQSATGKPISTGSSLPGSNVIYDPVTGKIVPASQGTPGSGVVYDPSIGQYDPSSQAAPGQLDASGNPINGISSAIGANTVYDPSTGKPISASRTALDSAAKYNPSCNAFFDPSTGKFVSATPTGQFDAPGRPIGTPSSESGFYNPSSNDVFDPSTGKFIPASQSTPNQCDASGIPTSTHPLAPGSASKPGVFDVDGNPIGTNVVFDPSSGQYVPASQFAPGQLDASGNPIRVGSLLSGPASIFDSTTGQYCPFSQSVTGVVDGSGKPVGTTSSSGLDAVYDPATGQYVPASQSASNSVFDPKFGQYISFPMPASDQLDASGDPIAAGSTSSVPHGDYDPSTGKFVPTSQITPGSNVVYNPSTGQYVSASQAETGQFDASGNLIGVISSGPSTGCDTATGKTISATQAASGSNAVYDPATGKLIPVSQSAPNSNVFDPITGQCVPVSHHTTSQFDASGNPIGADSSTFGFNAVYDSASGKLVPASQITPGSSVVYDPSTGQYVPASQSATGQLNAVGNPISLDSPASRSNSVYDPATGKYIPASQSMPGSNVVYNPVTGQFVPASESATSQCAISSNPLGVNSSASGSNAFYPATSKFIPASQSVAGSNTVYDPATGKYVSVSTPGHSTTGQAIGTHVSHSIPGGVPGGKLSGKPQHAIPTKGQSASKPSHQASHSGVAHPTYGSHLLEHSNKHLSGKVHKGTPSKPNGPAHGQSSASKGQGGCPPSGKAGHGRPVVSTSRNRVHAANCPTRTNPPPSNCHPNGHNGSDSRKSRVSIPLCKKPIYQRLQNGCLRLMNSQVQDEDLSDDASVDAQGELMDVNDPDVNTPKMDSYKVPEYLNADTDSQVESLLNQLDHDSMPADTPQDCCSMSCEDTSSFEMPQFSKSTMAAFAGIYMLASYKGSSTSAAAVLMVIPLFCLLALCVATMNASAWVKRSNLDWKLNPDMTITFSQESEDLELRTITLNINNITTILFLALALVAILAVTSIFSFYAVGAIATKGSCCSGF